jgi:hypothetical protein
MKKLVIIFLTISAVVYLIILAVVNTDKKEFNKTLNENLQSDSLKVNDAVYHFIACNNYDSALLKFSKDFVAMDIELYNSISPLLDSFLKHIDTNCLRKQNLYKFFISTILAKLAVHHLKCCNNGYDLYQMEGASANIIIHEFENLSGYRRNELEMLNSGSIFDFIKKDSSLGNNKLLKSLDIQYKNEERRIEKGIF